MANYAFAIFCHRFAIFAVFGDQRNGIIVAIATVAIIAVKNVFGGIFRAGNVVVRVVVIVARKAAVLRVLRALPTRERAAPSRSRADIA